jgi:Tfp pilus assembly pilus retraction ATPase PilT
MTRNAKPFLLNQLRPALRVNAEELRFVSGQQPSVKVAGSLRPADGAPVRAQVVQALHETCLSESKQNHDLHHAAQAVYSVVLPSVGAFRCEFKAKGNTKSLSLFPEPEEGVLVSQARKSGRPSLGAEAAAGEAE